MNHPYIKPVFVTYLIVMAVIAFFGNNKYNVHAEEVIEEVTVKQSKVYQLEMNQANFEEIKKDVLQKDVKYIAYPEALENDLALSEIVIKDIDFASEEVQKVEVEVVRYTSAKESKQVVDRLVGNVSLVFVDTIAPEIILSESSIELEEGSDFDANDYLESVVDNSFAEVKVDIEDNVDVDTPGEYTVVYTATDASNNKSTATLTVEITEIEEEEEEVVAEAPVAQVQSSYTPPVVSASTGSDVMDTLNIINQHRASLGYAPLALGGAGEQQAAAVRAAEAAGYVSHVRPDGRSYETAFTDLGIYHNNVLENLTFYGSTPASHVGWWMSSPAHRAALMNPSATHIAIGISGGMYAALIYN